VKNLGWFLGVLLIASCEFPRPADVGPKDGAPDDAAPDDAGVMDGPASVSTNCQLTAIEPALANTDDTVTIEGTFADTVTVNFPGGTSAPATVLGPHRATIIVPASATAGDLTITTCGSTVGPVPFRRASFQMGLGMFGAELDQASGAHQMTKLVTARDSHTATVIGGHLYIVGGVGSGGSLNSVEAAVINADGTLGPFTIAGDVTLATARQAHTAVAIGNRLYVLGGLGIGALSSVEQATIGPDGLLGTFATVAGVTLTTARQGHTSAVIGNYLYVFGGFGGSALNSIERAAINTDGSLGPFMTVSGVSLAAARYGHTTTIVGNKLYIIGGAGSGGTLRDVEQATINADGSLGPFEAAAGVMLSAARTTHSAVVLGKAIYVVGGVGASGSLTSVEQLAINDDSSLKAVAPATGVSLTSARRGHAAVVLGNYFYVFGGAGGSYLNSVETASINISGGLEALIPAPGVMFTFQRTKPTMAVVGNYLYAIGGAFFPGGNSIERSTISTDGTLAPFSVVPDIVTMASHGLHTIAIIGNYIYIVGGDNGGSLDTVERALINPDSSLGAFAIVPGVTLRTARAYHTSVIVGNYLYVFGGVKSSGGAQISVNSTERAQINADGTLQTFSTVSNNSLTAVRSGQGTAIVGGHVYIVGGDDSAAPPSLEQSTIQADGSLGAFSIVAGVGFTIQRFLFSITLTGPYLNILGGSVSIGSGLDATIVERSNTTADGTLKPFKTFGTSIPVLRSSHTTPTFGNYVYIAGGLSKSVDWLQLK